MWCPCEGGLQTSGCIAVHMRRDFIHTYIPSVVESTLFNVAACLAHPLLGAAAHGALWQELRPGGYASSDQSTRVGGCGGSENPNTASEEWRPTTLVLPLVPSAKLSSLVISMQQRGWTSSSSSFGRNQPDSSMNYKHITCQKVKPVHRQVPPTCLLRWVSWR